MDFLKAIEVIRAGGAVSVPLMPGCVVFAKIVDGVQCICMRSPNGKVVTNWLPASLLSADWSAVERPIVD